MKLFHNKDGKVVGTRDGNFTHWFGDPKRLTDLTEIEADEALAKDIRDPKNPLHASHLKVQNKRVVLPDQRNTPPTANIKV